MGSYTSQHQVRGFVFCLVTMLLLVPTCGKKSDSDSQDATSVSERKSRDSLVVEIVAEDSLDVLSVLQSDHDVVAKISTMGAFVTSIDGMSGGGNCYWLYSVNGEMAQEACDKMIVGAGDTVRWLFRHAGN